MTLRYFVDNDAAQHPDPGDANGALLSDLETTDVSALVENGFKLPEPLQGEGGRRHHGSGTA